MRESNLRQRTEDAGGPVSAAAEANLGGPAAAAAPATAAPAALETTCACAHLHRTHLGCTFCKVLWASAGGLLAPARHWLEQGRDSRCGSSTFRGQRSWSRQLAFHPCEAARVLQVDACATGGGSGGALAGNAAHGRDQRAGGSSNASQRYAIYNSSLSDQG